jgi:hypothetical protein
MNKHSIQSIKFLGIFYFIHDSRENYITELHDRPKRPETLEVKPEEEVDADEKGPYILQSEVEKNHQGNEE